MKLVVVLAIAASTLLPAAQPEFSIIEPEKGLILANTHVRLEFSPGAMGLAAMTDLASGRNHLAGPKAKLLLWEIAMGRGTQTRTLDNSYKPCNYARLERWPGGAQRAVLEWNDLRWHLEDKVLTVRVTIDLPSDSGVAEWRIFVGNHSDYWGLSSVAFPIAAGLPEAGEYDVARPVFASGGHLLKALRDKIRARHPSGGWPMQVTSLNRGRDAVYLAAMDPDGRAKDFVIEPGSRLSLIHYPENMAEPGSDWPDHYAVAFGCFQGGWVEAARRYRGWALKQKWAQAGPVSRRAEMPDLIKNAAIWMQDGWEWNQAAGTPEQMNAPFLEARERMGVPMALHWYNWHHMPFDNLYPHFLPAKPGFAERTRQLTARGLLIMPYINGSSADMNIPDFDRFAPHAIRDEAGGLRHHFYSDAAGRLLTMCPAREFWQGQISRVIDGLANLGVNGVYVDQISAMEQELCFDRSHGHPLGGGRYWTDGHRTALRKIRNEAQRNGRALTITSEGADEVFFDLLDANLTWAQPDDREIPFMEMVYSGYTLFFGSPCDYKQSDRFFRFAQGQALIDGRQNGWMGFGLFAPEYARKADYLRQCGRYHVAAAKFLTFGQLLQPIVPASPVPGFTDDAFGWNTKRRATVPAAEGRLWKAEDGTLGIMLVNYIDEKVPFAFRVDPARLGLAGGSWRVREIRPEGAGASETVRGAVEKTVALAPGEIKFLEVSQ
jgi:hypothetical protein